MCVASYLDSVASVDRRKDISLNDADNQGCPADTPTAGGVAEEDLSGVERRQLTRLCERLLLIIAICTATNQLTRVLVLLIKGFATVPGFCDIALLHAYESNLGDHNIFPFMAASEGNNPT